MPSELFDIVTRFGERADRVTHVEDLPARPGHTVDWPAWLHPPVRDAFVSAGIEVPYAHQVEAADHAHAGRNVIIATGTASG
ncbi:MAG TPA: helicase, partial [Candidatus Brevibacterium intestinigallinarum]|nr:helicase [Candidatus Brevibacterium intestinigallinarum]